MRIIEISTDAFAALWASRRDGEDDEDAILRRILGVGPRMAADRAGGMPMARGFSDPRFNFEVPEGFGIFRKLRRGPVYRARAIAGAWRLAGDGTPHASLSELSLAIGASGENAWEGWFYSRPDGSKGKVGELRDPATVQRRGR